jgi:DNA polymerase-3 subunit epsilon
VHLEQIEVAVKQIQGFSTMSVTRKDVVAGGLMRLVKAGDLQKDRFGFYWISGDQHIQVRSGSSDRPDSVRKPLHVSPDEVMLAMYLLTRDGRSIEPEELKSQVIRLFGWERRGTDADSLLERALHDLIFDGDLQRLNDGRLTTGTAKYAPAETAVTKPVPAPVRVAPKKSVASQRVAGSGGTVAKKVVPAKSPVVPREVTAKKAAPAKLVTTGVSKPPKVGRPKSQRELVLIDTETTGFDRAARVIEIAWVVTDSSLKVITKGSSLLRGDGHGGSASARAVHKIRDSEIRSAPEFPVVWRELNDLRKGRILVAHNAKFDLRMINGELQRFGLSSIETMACTMQMARSMGYAGRGKNGESSRSAKLGELAQRLNLNVQPTHRALQDAETTLELIRYFMRRNSRELEEYLAQFRV